jgi:hypothetical protein
MTHDLPNLDDDELRRSVYWYGRAWHHREQAAQRGVIYWLELHACVSPGRLRPVPELGEAVVDALLAGREPPGKRRRKKSWKPSRLRSRKSVSIVTTPRARASAIGD